MFIFLQLWQYFYQTYTRCNDQGFIPASLTIEIWKCFHLSAFQPPSFFLIPRSSDVSDARWRVSWLLTDRPSTVLHCSLPARTRLTPTTRRATACRRTVSPNTTSLPQNVPMVFLTPSEHRCEKNKCCKIPPKKLLREASGGRHKETKSVLDPLIYDSKYVICLVKPSVRAACNQGR